MFSEIALQFIIGTSTKRICRLCLQEQLSGGSEFANLYDEIRIQTQENCENIKLIEILEKFINTEINADILPNDLCSQCTEQLVSQYIFFKKCHENIKMFENAAEYLLNIVDHPQLVQQDENARTKIYLGVDLQNTICFSCELCNINFDNELMFKLHYEKHVSNNTDLDVEEMHEKCKKKMKPLKKNSNTKSLACESCGKLLSSQLALNKHKSKSCAYSQQYFDKFYCDMCSYSGKTKKLIYTHIISKHSLANRPCQVCGKLFKTQFAIYKHMITHTKERNFKCEFCPKTFVNNRALLWHRRLHLNERPFPCGYCDKKFVNFARRTEHFKATHAQIKYECEFCHVKYSKASTCKRHKISVHGVETAERL